MLLFCLFFYVARAAYDTSGCVQYQSIAYLPSPLLIRPARFCLLPENLNQEQKPSKRVLQTENVFAIYIVSWSSQTLQSGFTLCRGRERSPSPHRRGITSSRRHSRSRSRSRSRERRIRPNFLDMDYGDYRKNFKEVGFVFPFGGRLCSSCSSRASAQSLLLLCHLLYGK